MNKYLSFIFLSLMSAAFSSFAGDGTNKQVIANFEEKVLVVPCVFVDASPFDGFYNVVLVISGDGSGLEWKVRHVTLATEDECVDNDQPQDMSLDDLLHSLGMPPLSVLTDPHYYDSLDDDDDGDSDDDDSDDGDGDNSDDDSDDEGFESEGEIVIR